MKIVKLTLSFLLLTTSSIYAAQLPDPENLECTISEIEFYQTKQERILKEKIIKPNLNANRDGFDSQILFENKAFEINIELSFLRYTPLVNTSVIFKAKNIKPEDRTVVETGLNGSVYDSTTGNQIKFNCTYDLADQN